MQKILKLTGVSMLAIMTATNANAAGYTCEELVEYTSCNAGYYLVEPCPDGYEYGLWCYGNYNMASDYVGINLNNMDIGNADPEEYCYSLEIDPEEATGIFDSIFGYGWGCYYSDSEDYDFTEPDGTMSCEECPAGSTCAGGTADATPCPAGSYCAGSKLTEPTGLCAVGTFSTGGTTECTSCPEFPIKDKNGNVVTTTTASTGTTSVQGCYIDSNTYFADAKGTYRYAQNCMLEDGYTFYELADGETCSDGSYPVQNVDGIDVNACVFIYSEEYCNSLSSDWYYENGSCSCGTSDIWIEDGEIICSDP